MAIFLLFPSHDIFAMASKFVGDSTTFDDSEFVDSEFSLDFTSFESSSIVNSPNLSILPLLAYHKICNDHYRNEKWQPFEPWTCNIDYLRPTDSMDAKSFIKSSTFTALMTSIIDLENSNLPIDYFTSVLPRAQYGDESAVPAYPILPITTIIKNITVALIFFMSIPSFIINDIYITYFIQLILIFRSCII